MKPLLKILLVSMCVILASGCAHNRSNTRTQKAEGNQVLVIDKFHSVDARVEHSFVDGAVGFAVELAIKAAKKLIDMEAARYEAEYADKASHVWSGVQFIGNDALADTLLTESKVIVFSRTVTNQSNGLSWRWEDDVKRNALLDELIKSAGQWIADKGELVRLRNELSGKLPKKGFPTFVMLAVVSPFSKESREAMTASLGGYFYPALKAKRSQIRVPFTKWHKVETAVAVQFTGPEGQRGHQDGQYEATGGFKLGDITQDDKWVSFKPGEKVSHPLAIPTSPVVSTQVKVVESSQMKKRIGQLAEAVGKLKASDLGIDK